MEERNTHWLVIGLIAYLLVIGWHTLEPIGRALPLFVCSGLLVLSYAGHFLYFRAMVNVRRFRSVDHLLTVATITGILAFSSTLMADFSKRLVSNPWQGELLSQLIDFMRLYVVLVYLLFVLFLFKKLLFYQKKRSVILLWRLFALLTITASIASFQGFSMPRLPLQLAWATGITLSMILATRIKWIAFQDRANHWLSIGLLSVIVLVVIGLWQQLERIDLPLILLEHPVRNLFLYLIIGMVLIYGVFSILALFFNLPISSVMEDKDSEIKSYQELHDMILNRDSPEDVFKKLFSVCMSNTFSDAGWLELRENRRKPMQIAEGVEVDDIELLERSLSFDARFEKQTASDHIYFPMLSPKTLSLNGNGSIRYQSMLVYPIRVEGELVGKIGLLKEFEDGFDDYMIGMGKSYIQQSKVVYENVSLLKSKIEAELDMEQMRVARKVQRGLLPDSFPKNDYVSVSAFSESALEVGGDYYDFFRLGEDRFAFVIGDVSGKGTSAAFHMAQLKGIFQSLIQLELEPAEFMKLANQSVNNCVKQGLFITFTLVLLDFELGKMVYSRAGHCPLLIYSATQDSARYLEDDGIALGIMESEQFVHHQMIYELPLETGDIIALYTDGISEGRNAKTGEPFDYDRLLKTLMKSRFLDANAIRDRIYSEFKAFTVGDLHRDDASLMIIKVQ